MGHGGGGSALYPAAAAPTTRLERERPEVDVDDPLHRLSQVLTAVTAMRDHLERDIADHPGDSLLEAVNTAVETAERRAFSTPLCRRPCRPTPMAGASTTLQLIRQAVLTVEVLTQAVTGRRPFDRRLDST